MLIKLITVLAFMLIASSTSIMNAALIMDFSTAAQGSFLTAPFEQNGIRLTLLTGHYDILDFGVTGLAGNLDVVIRGGGFGRESKVRISLVTGSLFNLDSITFLDGSDRGFLFAPGGPVTGYRGKKPHRNVK